MVNKIIKKIKESFREPLSARNIAIKVLIGAFLLFFITSCPVFAAMPASWGDAISGTVGLAVATVVGFIAMILTSILGLILTLLIGVLVNVAQFSKIIEVDAVVRGWVIVRDLCNMFFILILLVIAFATILRQENYSAKRLLPKLLIMAVLINFSKTIFGLIIDFAQVIMLTFVNGFAQYGWAKFIEMFNIKAMMEIKPIFGESEKIDNFSVAGSIIAGLIAIIITIIVVAVMLAVLVVRIVMLWVYTILSPLVFLGFAFPPIQKYTGRIWEDFSKQVIVGPVLAFFIWLALLTAQTSSEQLAKDGNEMFKNVSSNSPQTSIKTSQDNICAGLNKFFCDKNFQAYIITIALLIGGLMVTQQMGGAAASIAGKGMQWAKSASSAPFKGGLKLGKNIGSWGVDKLSEKAGIDFNVVRGYKRLTAKMDSNKRERESKIYSKTISTANGEGAEGAKPGYIRSKLAMASTGDLAWDEFTSGSRGIKNLVMSNNWREKKKKEIIGEKDDQGNVISKGKIKEAEEERAKVWTTDEAASSVKTIQTLEKNYTDKDKEVRDQMLAVRTAPPDMLVEEQGKLKKLREERDNINSQLKPLKKKLTTNIIDNKKAGELDEQIKELNLEADHYEFEGIAEARADAKQVVEAEGNKKITNIEDPMQLVHMMVKAMEKGQQGLVAAISKKLTKQGNYNEFLRALNLGTGRNGMIEFSKMLQDKNKGGFTRQAALSLVAEIGELAKNVKHFSAYGAVKLEHGNYTEASQDEADAAQLNEMLKVQVQDFARNTGRLGLGEYKTGMPHTLENWIPTRAALAMYKLNPGEKGLAQNIAASGQASGILHMGMVIDILKKNNIDPKLIEAILIRKGTTSDIDYNKFIKEINNEKI